MKETVEEWELFLGLMKKCVSATISKQALEYSEKIRTMDSQRTLPGWNYCQFFLLKEGLAITYQRAGMMSESLRLYQELEILFLNLKDQKNAPSTPNNLNGPLDTFISDSFLKNKEGVVVVPSILNLLKKKPELREEIYKSSICELYLRSYIFSRQADIIFAIKQPNKVALMAISFIKEMYVHLREKCELLKPHFAERWAYKAYLDVIEECEKQYNELSNKQQQKYEGSSNVEISFRRNSFTDIFRFRELSPKEHCLYMANLYYFARTMVNPISPFSLFSLSHLFFYFFFFGKKSLIELEFH